MATKYIKLGSQAELFIAEDLGIYLNKYNAAEVKDDILTNRLRNFINTGYLVEIKKVQFDNIRLQSPNTRNAPLNVTQLAQENYLNPVNTVLNTPAIPMNIGDRYLVGLNPKGAWLGYKDHIASWNGNSWDFTTPENGFILPIYAAGVSFTYSGTFPSGSWQIPENSLLSIEESTGEESSKEYALRLFQIEALARENADLNLQIQIDSFSSRYVPAALVTVKDVNGYYSNKILEPILQEIGAKLSNVIIKESDPIFQASPAARIKNDDITNWDKAYSWADHSSGLILDGGGEVTINVDNPAQIDISEGKGILVDYWTEPGKKIVYKVSWFDKIGIDIENIATSTISYIGINKNGNVVQFSSKPTNSERCDNIILAQIGHSNNTTVGFINDYTSVYNSPMETARDIISELNLVSTGNIISPNGANLSVNKSAGYLFGLGINKSDSKNPNRKPIVGQEPVSFRYRTQLGGSGTSTTLIDPTVYDNAGTITSIPGASTQATNQRVYLFPNGNVIIQYGQTVYPTLAAAVSGSQSEPFIKYSNVDQGAILIAIIAVTKNATNLSNSNQAKILPVSKFGESVGSSAGISVSTLQNAYDNSSTDPEILTDSIRGALTLRRGSASDTDNVFVIENGAGAVKYAVNGNGQITSDTLVAGGLVKSVAGVLTLAVANVDYAPGTGGTGYIQNQFSVSQVASMAISGKAAIADGIQVGGAPGITGVPRFLINNSVSGMIEAEFPASTLTRLSFQTATAIRDIVFPNASGTIALTSDITSSLTGYLPLTAGVTKPLTGDLYGTSATFNSTVRAQNFNVFESSASRGGLYTYNIISGAGTDYSVGLFSEVEAWIAPNGATTRTARFTSSLTQFSTNTTILGHTTIGAAGGVRSLAIPGANSGGIYLYGAYSGSPASPGIDIYNQLGTLTFSHNSNGGSTNIAGNLNLTKSSPLLVLNDTGGLAAQIGSFSNQLNFIDNATGTKGFNINLSSGAPTFTYFAGSGDRILFTNSSGGVSAGSIGSGLSWDAVNKVLSATGGATGTVTGTGTAGYIGKWTSASNIANSIMSESSSTIFVAGAINATAHYIIAGASPRGGIYTYSSISGSGSDYSLGLYSEGDLYLAASGTASKLLTLNTTSATFIVPITATSFSGAGTGLTGTASGLTAGAASLAYQWNSYSGANVTTPYYLMAFNNSTGQYGYSTASQVQSFLGLGSAAYINASASSTGNTIVQRDASGNINGNYGQFAYINTSQSPEAGTVTAIITRQGDNYMRVSTAGPIQSFLGLGSNAYTSTAYLPLSGGTLSGALAGTSASFSSSVTASGGFFNSDVRLKDIFSYSLDLFDLKSTAFTWKKGSKREDGNKIHYGYLAHEVEKYLPDAITVGEDGYKSVNYAEVHTVKIQQLEDEVRELKSLIYKLGGQL